MAARASTAKHEPRGRHRSSSSSSSGGGGGGRGRGLSKSASGNRLTVSGGGGGGGGGSGSTQSLVYWSHSRDENEFDDAFHGFAFGGREDEDYEVGSQSSLSDSSLYYSEDDASRRSQITGVVSLASSCSSGADRYFDEHEQDDVLSLGEVSNTSSSSGANVYIFTDDDSLSPRDHRLAANESRRLVFRSNDDSLLNPPSLLETPGYPGSVGSSPNVSPMRMSPMLDTPSGIMSPSSWQQYNQRRGKLLARKMLFETSQHHPHQQDQGPSNPPLSSSPSRQSLWSRVTRSGPVRSNRDTVSQHLRAGISPQREGRTKPSHKYAHRRLSLVGSWEENDEGGDDDDDDDDDGKSVHIVHCHEGGGIGGGGSGWDVRADARDIVDRLDLGDDGHQVLDEIEAALDGTTRGAVKDDNAAAANAVHMPPFPSSRALIPFWPILHGTLWLPRYDLYVEQALRSSLSLLAA